MEPRRLLAVSFSFAINDPGGANAAFYDDVLTVMEEAGREWGQMFDSTVNIEIDVSFEFSGGEFIAATYVDHYETIGSQGGVEIVEVGPVNEIRTGIDPNGIEPDAHIIWATDYLDSGQMSFNVDDERVVPANQLDGLTVMLHEIGHFVGVYSLLDRFTGQPGQVPELDYRVAMTTLDVYVGRVGGFLAFSPGDFGLGAASITEQIYGPVPMSLITGAHYEGGGPTIPTGVTLDDFLMSASIGDGQRQSIGEIDLAILADMGLPMSDLVVFPTAPIAPILHITGSVGDDYIAVGTSGEFLWVDRNFQEDIQLPLSSFGSFVIEGFGGRDYIILHDDIPSVTVYGGDGGDTIIGTNDNDTLYGGAGGDWIVGKGGADILVGNGGRDKLLGEDGNDTLSGGPGNDTLDGAAGEDLLVGHGDPDLLLGGVGNDRMIGGSSSDSLFGDGGDDYMEGGTAGDYFDGGAGRDSVDYSSRLASVSLSLNGLRDDGEAGEEDNLAVSIDMLIGGAGNDRISGDGRANHLYGGAGKDSIDGGSGDDQIFGEGGNDVLQGQDGRDIVKGGGGNDRIVGGGLYDDLFGGAGNDYFITNDRYSDFVDGGSGTDTVGADELDELTSLESIDITPSGV